MFFFSSRRRHTRWPRDWSSDVCSSDLPWSRALRCPDTRIPSAEQLMSISTFDLFTVGIGPSSSHTVGPMRAAARFAREAFENPAVGPRLVDVAVHLYGSLAATAQGHGTLDAAAVGPEGADPDPVDPVID